MRKILMRSAMPSEGGGSISDILVNNYVGNNTGNLLYQESVARMIMTEDTMITTTKIKKDYSEQEIEEINAQYEMFIIPLANAFRVSFISEIENLTHLIERLTIPCVVIGVGVQRPTDTDRWNYPFDEPVQAFLKAVLKKSVLIGVRGEVTAEYLDRKGFVPEKDFTVIGCPSLHTFGDNLPKPTLSELNFHSKVSVNFKAELPEEVYTFLRRQSARFRDYTFITQVIKEIKNLYVGYPYPENEIRRSQFPADYPIHFTDQLMQEDKMVGFVDSTSWINYLSSRDFNFGSRIHGNIASILAGTPCYIITSDSRVKELADYHHIPHIVRNELQEQTTIYDLYEKADYGALQKGHAERFSLYLDFLDKNQVKRLTREQMNAAETPFDRQKQRQQPMGAIRSFSSCSLEEQERRVQEYFSSMEA
ncbi:MAG: polysaccharide pyruvyl transferase family protein [Clostridiales bacterium]|nr:polysaccharide pyruvyl transferase family protein [Clostridiales bacterium]